MIHLFTDYLRNKGSSPHTIKTYQSDLIGFFASLTDLKEHSQPVKQWAKNLTGKPATVNRKIQAVKSYYNWANKFGYMDRNPAKDLHFRKVPKRLPKFLINQAAPENLTLEQTAAITLLNETGMRLAELLSIKVKDVDHNQLKVTGKGNKERIIPISKKVAALLSELKEAALLSEEKTEPLLSEQHCFPKKTDTLLFGLKRHQVQYLTRKLYGCNPHTLRHTFATTLINNGAPLLSIKELLGHSRVSTTEIYTHLDFNRLKEIHSKCHPKA